jgi:spermidine synthase
MLGSAATPGRLRAVSVGAAVGLAILLVVTSGGSRLDRSCDEARFPGYEIRESFDTRYGHQVILSRDSALVLVTDNAVEATAPDLETAENLLIPSLVYCRSATSVLYVGRSELGLAELAGKLPNVHLTAVDPRGSLSERLEAIIPLAGSVTRIDDDPVAFLTNTPAGLFEVVVLNAGRLDSYRSSRLLTPQFLGLVRRSLKEPGLLLLRTGYDTDRYVTDETAELLSTIVATLNRIFTNLAIWPGTSTLVMASETWPLDLPMDSIIARTETLSYEPYYISDYYLRDRLNEFKVARVHDVPAGAATANGIQRPVLTAMDSWYRAKASESDRALAGFVLKQHYWLIVVPVAVVLFFLWAAAGRRNRGRTGMFLYFTAGVVSLSLELVSFYVYQSMAGSLYSSLAVLIGTFMLGLALGTWLAGRTVGLGIGRLSLATLVAATALFGLTWSMVDFRLALVYHLLFLFVVSVATGTLFVAATRCYYGSESGANRGLGYAAELGGSALGALLVLSVLLPLLGLAWVLACLGIVTVLGGGGLHWQR